MGILNLERVFVAIHGIDRDARHCSQAASCWFPRQRLHDHFRPLTSNRTPVKINTTYIYSKYHHLHHPSINPNPAHTHKEETVPFSSKPLFLRQRPTSNSKYGDSTVNNDLSPIRNICPTYVFCTVCLHRPTTACHRHYPRLYVTQGDHNNNSDRIWNNSRADSTLVVLFTRVSYDLAHDATCPSTQQICAVDGCIPYEPEPINFRHISTPV